MPPNPSPATYEYHAGDAFLASLNPAFSPDVAMASNGDRIQINGTGTLSVFPKGVTGGGTEFDSMINVRPSQGNRSRNVEDPVLQGRIRQVVTVLVEG